MKHQVRAELWNVEFQVFFREDCRLALVVHDSHQLRVDIAILSKQQCHKNEEGVHDHGQALIIMQVFDVSRYHALKGGLSVLGGQQREVEILNR